MDDHTFAILAELKAMARERHRAAADDSPRREHLAAVARELGFRGWPHLVAVLNGTETSNFGTLLYAPACHAHFNIWSASADEARQIRAEHGGWLLPYRHQFVIVDEHFVKTLGLDPNDADWTAMGRDWTQPQCADARRRLAARVVHARARTTHKCV